MSVQAGIWNYDGKPVDRQLLVSMSQATTEYGPDGEGLQVDGNLGMLYRSFCTTVESHAESQPYLFADRKLITWDGRLDNRDELISDIGAGLTSGEADLSIVVAAFAKWKTGCFAKFLGDWAVAIWDASKEELILARDYIGIKRIFYYPRDNSVVWCSQLAPLVLCGDKFQLCDEYLAGYLSFMPEAHLTPYREIRSVRPGTFVSIVKGNIAINTYWSFNPSRKKLHKTDREYEEHFCTLFRQAVRCRLRTDSPILSDLSGGLDSSSIVCMADDIRCKEALAIPCVETFSFFDPDDPDEEDFLYFTEVEEHRGKVGHHAQLQSCGDSFSPTMSGFSAVPGFGTRQELRAARSEVVKRGGFRVILSGNGGDQILGQGLDFRVALGDALLECRFTDFVNQLVTWSLATRRPALQLFVGTLALLMPRQIRGLLSGATKELRWISHTFAQQHRVADRILPGTEGLACWRPTARNNFQTLLRLSGEMTHSASSREEIRYPYLDQRLVEFLFSVPTDQLFRSGQRRSLMRRALAAILPGSVLSRQTKSSTGRHIVLTVNKHQKAIAAILREPLSVRLGYLNGSTLNTALSQLQQGIITPFVGQLLRGLSLEIWLRDVSARGICSASPSWAMSSLSGRAPRVRASHPV